MVNYFCDTNSNIFSKLRQPVFRQKHGLLSCRIFTENDICVAAKEVFVFFMRGFGCAFFIFGDDEMEKELYWNMYSKLFNSTTDALPYIESSKAAQILKQAQIDTEEMYISFDDSKCF